MKVRTRSLSALTVVVLMLSMAGLVGVIAPAFHAPDLSRTASAAGQLAPGVRSMGALNSATLSINPPSTQQGGSVNFMTSVSGGTSPFTYNYEGLPSGCMNHNFASFTCNPSQTGMYSVSVMVMDVHGNTTTSPTASLDVTSSSNGNGNNGGGGNNSSNPFSSLLSGLGGVLTYVLIFGIIGFATWILLIVGVWVIAVVLMRRLPKRGASVPVAATVTCPSCSATIPGGTKFCPECGKPTAPKGSQATGTP